MHKTDFQSLIHHLIMSDIPYLCIAAKFKSPPAYDTTQVLNGFQEEKNVFILEMLFKV